VVTCSFHKTRESTYREVTQLAKNRAVLATIAMYAAH